jgi:hypothetical protein
LSVFCFSSLLLSFYAFSCRDFRYIPHLNSSALLLMPEVLGKDAALFSAFRVFLAKSCSSGFVQS